MFAKAAGYERYMGRWSRLLASQYLAFAQTGDGERVLDLGCGTGALALALAARTRTSEVVGIDSSEDFVAAARRNSPTSRTRFQVGDAQALPFPDGYFDHAMALLVLNFVKDAGKAVEEMRRVTRPGGAASACVWDYNEGMEMARLFWDEAIALDPAMEPKDQRHMRFARQGELADAWKQAGFLEVQEGVLQIEQAYASFEDYWLPFLEGAGAAGAFVEALSAERRQALEFRLRTRALGARPDGPFTLRARAWCVRGLAPAPGQT